MSILRDKRLVLKKLYIDFFFFTPCCACAHGVMRQCKTCDILFHEKCIPKHAFAASHKCMDMQGLPIANCSEQYFLVVHFNGTASHNAQLVSKAWPV